MRRGDDLRLGREAHETHELDTEHDHRRSNLAWILVFRRCHRTHVRVTEPATAVSDGFTAAADLD